MSYQRTSGYGNITPVVKNIIIINGLFFLATMAFNSLDIQLDRLLSMWYFDSSQFGEWQIVTHMFMHGGITHIFFNMLTLYFFGTQLERIWGTQRFLFFYLSCGLCAALVHMGVNAYQVYSVAGSIIASPEMVNIASYPSTLYSAYKIPVLGASGAVYGVFAAFAYLFPNTRIMLLIPPIPLKAKWLVLGLVIFDLYSGVNGLKTGIAHFAHLGGALFGFIMVYYWNKKGQNFY